MIYVFSLRIKGEPVGKGAMRKGGGCYTALDVENYEKKIKEMAAFEMRRSGISKMKECPLEMLICVFYRVPDGVDEGLKDKMIDGAVSPCLRPDSDEMARVMMDALNGVVYSDDAQICKLVVNKWYVNSDPGVDVYVDCL